MASLVRQSYMKYFPIGLPPPESFKDAIAVVTGGTSGLGLATAIHLINFGAKEVIISSRNTNRAQSALQTIEKETAGRSKNKVRVLELEMSNYRSIVAFASELKKIRTGLGGIDYVLLNAGVTAGEFRKSSEGWEESIQVNTLSTVLLAQLLLPWMKSERANRSAPVHLAAVSSSQQFSPAVDGWNKWMAKDGGESVLAHWNKLENYPGPTGAYSLSKKFLEYCFADLARQALDKDGRPEVIITTMCPGIVKTDLSRDFKTGMFAAGVAVFLGLFGKSAENGARTLLYALLAKEDEHGSFIRFYDNGESLTMARKKLLKEEPSSSVQKIVWGEVREELSAKVPEFREALC